MHPPRLELTGYQQIIIKGFFLLCNHHCTLTYLILGILLMSMRLRVATSLLMS